MEERALDCCIRMHQEHPNGLQMPTRFGIGGLDEAYERCGVVTASYAKTFYLGTQLMTPEKAKAVWAVYVWCRRTDELVDGPNASRITPEVITPTCQQQTHHSTARCKGQGQYVYSNFLSIMSGKPDAHPAVLHQALAAA